jgi:hypothetical protein
MRFRNQKKARFRTASNCMVVEIRNEVVATATVAAAPDDNDDNVKIINLITPLIINTKS